MFLDFPVIPCCRAPTQGMHQQLLAVLGAPDRQASSLVRAAVSARKTGAWRWVQQTPRHIAFCTCWRACRPLAAATCSPLRPSCSLPADHYAQATTSLYKLRGLLQQAAGGAGEAAPAWAQAMSAADAGWRVEEAKLLWAQGQQDTAVQLARSLLGARCA